jgi:hypothetical protein
MDWADARREEQDMSILKNSGWRGVGEFVAIIDDATYGSTRVQVCGFDRQADMSGQKRTRTYYELRTASDVTMLPPVVRSQKAAKEAAVELYGERK